MAKLHEPKYTVEDKKGNIEIRQYEPMTIAKIDMSGNRIRSLRSGFGCLANYIFKGERKIAMTAPVQHVQDNRRWQVQFVMPENETVDTLPTPQDKRIQLQALPAERKIAISFSGMNSDANCEKHLAKLTHHIAAYHLKTIGEPIYAFYNPPWTLPFFRRNEILFRLAD